MELEKVMEVLYDAEVNCDISSFWDVGWVVRLGDHHNGFKATVNMDTLEHAGRWLIDQAIYFYPEAQSLKDYRDAG